MPKDAGAYVFVDRVYLPVRTALYNHLASSLAMPDVELGSAEFWYRGGTLVVQIPMPCTCCAGLNGLSRIHVCVPEYVCSCVYIYIDT